MQQEQSAQQEGQQEGSTKAVGKVPGQHTEVPARRGAHRASAKVPDATVVLPAFITGKRPEPQSAESNGTESDAGKSDSSKSHATQSHAAELAGGALPASERGMLIFVAALLGSGTIAVVVVLGLGGFDSVPAAKPAPAGTVSSEPSLAPAPAPALPSPAPSSSPSPSPKQVTAPAKVALGTLTANDPRAFCSANDAGRVRRNEDQSWYCSGNDSHPALPFTPTDVCRWRYFDKTAYAVVPDIDNPTTWKCYT